ncbi:CIS tube protein [Christiangramia crocea]|uniref:LysM peptidoglycan-binding domain-containing protein n=1 Tax=Christiangramia crocea TaxID=2904124 RepID=A0A9X2A977_9FLAO|nr:LysM peptidoglycan-binding domain-containing protein [Gramella crocea]MCG9972588.1 LysM peptidoglycan-binding domain-containing protein [Gramella crocea]
MYSFSMNDKLTIKSFKNPRFEDELRDIGPFVVHVNPSTYTHSTQINFSEEQAPGTSANQNNHNNTEPVKLNFDFLLDRTGALGNLPNALNGVEEDIVKFKRIAIHFEGEIHKPRYLMLCWGSLIFKCQLEKLDIEYKLFNKEGKPLRANLKCVFREFKEDNLRVAEENKSSPDLSHIRTVKAGDSLQLLCYQIYGDAAYYKYIAEVNQLKQFRELREGQRLTFPPIEKKSNG